MSQKIDELVAENRQHKPVVEVTFYRARCTRCGTVCDDYGGYSAWSDDSTPVESMIDSGWLSRHEGRDLVELICEPCQVKMVENLSDEEEDELLEWYDG